MESKPPIWVLTFNRPLALSRQVKLWGRAGFQVNVFSNYPELQYEDNETYDLVKTAHFNSLSYKQSNSWCARSWNSIYIKCFTDNEAGIFVQDDTDCSKNLPDLIMKNVDKYDFIWGTAGDIFHYCHKNVLKTVGWWDERFLGCYCGDCDIMLRTWLSYDRDRLCIEESHDFGWIHNPIGLQHCIRTDVQSKAIDPTYENQHWELEKLGKKNYVLEHSQGHFKQKWGLPGNGINGIGPLANYNPKKQIKDIQWYPWFDAKYLDEQPRKHGAYD